MCKSKFQNCDFGVKKLEFKISLYDVWSIGKLNSSCPMPLTGTYYYKDTGWN